MPSGVPPTMNNILRLRNKFPGGADSKERMGSSPRGRTRATAWLLLPLLAALAGCGDHEAASAAASLPPTTVVVSPPLEREVQEFVDFTGRTEAVEDVEIRARVTGYLLKVAPVFEVNGTAENEVEKGDVLFEIDQREFVAELNAAVAAITSSEAQQLKAKAELSRQKALREKNVNTVADLDAAIAEMASADAAVGGLQSRKEIAELDIEFSTIKAPISGRVSRADLTPGNLVTANTSRLTTIVSQDPMYADFDVDERTLLTLQRRIREGNLEEKKHDEIVVLMGLSNDAGFPFTGRLSFVDNKVDPTTGTIRMRAAFDNPKPKVGQRPIAAGLFARIRVPLGKKHKALLVSERTLGTDQGQKFLYVVDDKNEVVYRPVKVGLVENGLRVIEEGLKANERVIVEGLQRVRPGAKVEAKAGEMPTLPSEADKAAPEKAPAKKSAVGKAAAEEPAEPEAAPAGKEPAEEPTEKTESPAAAEKPADSSPAEDAPAEEGKE